MKKDLQFLLDMFQSAKLITQYTARCSKEEFFNSIQLQDAVIRRLLVIAEAARRVSQVGRETLPNIPWQEINGMRNRLVHEYDDINFSVVWDVVQQEIPILIRELELKISSEK